MIFIYSIFFLDLVVAGVFFAFFVVSDVCVFVDAGPNNKIAPTSGIWRLLVPRIG